DANTLARKLSRSASLLQARGCGVLYWDKDKNILSAMRPFSGLDDANLKTLEFPVGGSAMGLSVLQDRPVLVDQSGEGQSDVDLLKQLNIQNAVSVPLALERRDDSNEIVERSIMGVFCAFDKYYGRPFDMEDARLLSMMARQVSAVLVTSQLYWKEVESKRRIQSILESTSVGLMAVSLKGTVTQVNAAARKALNVDGDGWFGRHYYELITNHEICGVVEQALSGFPPEEPKELTIMVGEGEEREERIYRVQIDQIRAEDGQALGWVIVFENVTDIRQAERMMAVFVDMMSHELRTPLTSIRGFVATLLQAGEGVFDWPTQEEFLQIVDTEAERLGGMIDDHLNIARIQNGRGLQFAFVPTDLRTVCGHVVRLLTQSSYMKGGHQLVVDIPDECPEIMADDAKLQQILHNLVGNALKYSPNGGEVRISAKAQEGGVLVSIKDQGLGIPADKIPKMFGQFFRVEEHTQTGIKGTGLGLWLTKHMVDGHHGRLWVESDYGHGSTFFIWLPLDPNKFEKAD
ncbi:MAG TPA: ATP-binding protein, partial [Armatimonadota bacterium]|nr:ATP-binding protein [Armatimonadota bacterium]